MSISTGALAVAEAAYGRAENAVAHVRMLTDTLDLHMPGAISEISPRSGCFVQAWSGYAVTWPLVARIFGLQPDAYHRRLTLSPRFPASWTEAHLTNVRIGGASFDFHWDGASLEVASREPGWTVTSSTVPVETRSI
jgi:glycogen debranching enzyme